MAMKGRGGFTLAEVTVAGAVLILLSLLVMKSVTLCGRLMNRTSQAEAMEQRLESYLAGGGEPEASHEVTVQVGSLGEWKVTVDCYEMEENGVRVFLKTLRDDGNES